MDARTFDARAVFARTLRGIERDEGSIAAFALSNGLEYFGLTRVPGGVCYREWAPAAVSVALIGDFNGWRAHDEHRCARNAWGVWELFLPDVAGRPAIAHGSRVKALVGVCDASCKATASARPSDEPARVVARIPAWIQRTHRDPTSGGFSGVYVDPHEQPYAWLHPRPPRPGTLKIYEAHVGISSGEERIASWEHFRVHVLPRVAALGYTALQLMAVQEHGCYESFGYHVTSFFAPACRFGPADELKRLIDAAHGLGLLVLMDVVHSHASANATEGLSRFDGSSGGYFHSGPRGHHGVWGSRLFAYGRTEVLRFLLANALHYAREYRFDGFRFDAVTTMLYAPQGLARKLASSQPLCAGAGGAHVPSSAAHAAGHRTGTAVHVDLDAVVYLMLANWALHDGYAMFGLEAPLITVAEECTGWPGLCQPPARGGLGFDYRLSIGVPPMWEAVASRHAPGRWPLQQVATELCKRRPAEPTIAYAECHDQSLVGAQTLAFRLMGADMYTHMTRLAAPTAKVEFGLGALKIIRLLTSALGGDGYLNFMGNEFGHPEWVDFPRVGNGWSAAHARRRWDLVDDELLRYRGLQAFDAAMHAAEAGLGWLAAPHASILCVDEPNQLLAFERAGLLFVANAHPTHSAHEYVARGARAEYGAAAELILNSDALEFGGRARPASLRAAPGGEPGCVVFGAPPATIAVFAAVGTLQAAG